MKIEGLESRELGLRILEALRQSEYINDAKCIYNAKLRNWTVYFYDVGHVPRRGKAKVQYQLRQHSGEGVGEGVEWTGEVVRGWENQGVEELG